MVRSSAQRAATTSAETHAIPGLWDAHAHLSYWGEDSLAMLLGHGITSIRELGGDPDEIAGWKEAVEQGDLIGPSMHWSGPFLEGPDGGDEYRWKVGSPEEARTAAHALLDRGVDFLKIQPRIGFAETAALVDAAREGGSYVVGHVPEGLSAIEASELGLRSIEHLTPFMDLSDEELDDTIAVLLDNGTWVSPALYSMVAQVEAAGGDRRTDPGLRRAYAVVRRLWEAGVPMLVGSNFAYRTWPHRPGSALHGEMEVLVEAGIPAADVLRMATVGNAGFLGVDAAEVRIAPGARADLVLLGGNPLEDIGQVRNIVGVVIGGRYFDAEAAARMRDGEQVAPTLSAR